MFVAFRMWSEQPPLEDEPDAEAMSRPRPASMLDELEAAPSAPA